MSYQPLVLINVVPVRLWCADVDGIMVGGAIACMSFPQHLGRSSVTGHTTHFQRWKLPRRTACACAPIHNARLSLAKITMATTSRGDGWPGCHYYNAVQLKCAS